GEVLDLHRRLVGEHRAVRQLFLERLQLSVRDLAVADVQRGEARETVQRLQALDRVAVQVERAQLRKALDGGDVPDVVVAQREGAQLRQAREGGDVGQPAVVEGQGRELRQRGERVQLLSGELHAGEHERLRVLRDLLAAYGQGLVLVPAGLVLCQ